MLILKSTACHEIDIRNSRFISEVFVVKSQEEARERLRLQKERYFDASHVVHAFVVGKTGGILGCSDDGEPAGTAGYPTMEVVKGSGITDILLTTTRYFGGIKLGTGGLVKAYTQSAQEVLGLVEAEEQVSMAVFQLVLPYAAYESAKRLLVSEGAVVEGESFGTDVTLNGHLRMDVSEVVRIGIRDLSRGMAQFDVTEEG